jgi:DNA-damage-inducible protein J
MMEAKDIRQRFDSIDEMLGDVDGETGKKNQKRAEQPKA